MPGILASILYTVRSNFATGVTCNSMEHSPSRDTNSCSADKEITRLLRNPKLHYNTDKSPSHPSYSRSWSYILLLSSHLRLNSLKRSFHFSSSDQNTVYISHYAHDLSILSSLLRHTNESVFGDVYKLIRQVDSICNASKLHSGITRTESPPLCIC
jgi:hypothetical protein